MPRVLATTTDEETGAQELVKSTNTSSINGVSPYPYVYVGPQMDSETEQMADPRHPCLWWN